MPSAQVSVNSCPSAQCTVTYTFANKQFIPAGRTISLTLAGLQAPGEYPSGASSVPESLTITTLNGAATVETGDDVSNPFYLRRITGSIIATSSDIDISSAFLNCLNGPFVGPACLTVGGEVYPSVNDVYNLGSASHQWAGLYVNSINAANLALTGNLSPSNAPFQLFDFTPGAAFDLYTGNNPAGVSGNLVLQSGTGVVDLESEASAGTTPGQVNVFSGADSASTGHSGRADISTGRGYHTGAIVLSTPVGSGGASSTYTGRIELDPGASTDLLVQNTSPQVQVSKNFSVGEAQTLAETEVLPRE